MSNKEVVPQLPTGSRPIIPKALSMMLIAISLSYVNADASVIPMSKGPPDLDAPIAIQVNALNSTMLLGEINRGSVLSFIQQIVGASAVVKPGQTLNVFVLSPGGDVEANDVLEKFLNAIPPVNLICVDCASAAAHLFVTYTKGNRYLLPKGYVLMHEMKINISANNLTELVMFRFKQENDQFDLGFSSVLGLSLEQYQQRIRDTQWVVYADEAVKLHVADKIVSIQCDSAMYQTWFYTCTSGGE